MLELTVRLVVSLAVVVGLLLLLAKFGARKFRGNAQALVHVVHRQPLSRTSAVAVVTVGSRVLVLGTTEQQVSVLAELDPDELDLAELADAEDFETVTAHLPSPAAVRLVQDAPALRVEPLAVARPGGSHRAAHRAPVGSPAGGALAGSALSPATWRQAFAVATARGPANRTARRAS